jgi:hypothetical protein
MVPLQLSQWAYAAILELRDPTLELDGAVATKNWDRYSLYFPE